MPTLVRLVVQWNIYPDDFEKTIKNNQSDGYRGDHKGGYRIVTLHRGGWLRQLWRVWRRNGVSG